MALNFRKVAKFRLCAILLPKLLSENLEPGGKHPVLIGLKFEEMHKMKLLSVIFKLVHTPDEFPEARKALSTQQFQAHGYNTRNKNDLDANYCHKKSYGCKKIPMEQEHWNSLPPSLKNEKSFNKFKASVKILP